MFQCGFVLLVISSLLSACGTAPPTGLQPEYPPAERERFKLWGKFIRVESLQPTLRWQQLPRPHHGQSDPDGYLERITDVNYQLRVWKTDNGFSGRLVYARDGLQEPFHQLEQPLEPLAKYLWSVRARFLLDGRPSVSEWGLSSHLLRGYTLPNPSCFRFSTP